MEPLPTAFAVLDILGYGALMRHEPKEIINLVQELINSETISRPVQIDLDKYVHFSGEKHAPVVKHLQFSDTLIIWLSSDPHAPDQLQKPKQLVESVSYAASRTLASFLAAGVPLRGAVGFGRTFISRDPLFFTGCELYETTKLERKQAWAGAALHDSAVKALKTTSPEDFIVEYTVPMYEAVEPKHNFAVDWASCLLCSQNLIPPWDLMFNSADSRVEEKGKETRRFFEIMKQQQRSYPAPLNNETILAMRDRLSGILSD